jgi:hypothetical protein
MDEQQADKPEEQTPTQTSSHSELMTEIVQKVSQSVEQRLPQPQPDTEQLEDSATNPKKDLKETIKHELREILAVLIYLGCWLSILATMKCLVLLQYGINEFKNAYIMAWITALAFAKVIVIAQKLPIVNKMRNRPLFWACVYKACFFTVITLAAHRAEERLMHFTHDPNDVFPVAGVIAHTLSLFAIFFILFAYRDLDLMLGKGSLKELFFKSRQAS